MGTWEWTVLNFIQENIRNEILDGIVPAITALGNAGMIWIILACALMISKKHRTTGMILVAAMVIDAVLCNGILKPLVDRMRPFEVNPDIVLLIPPPQDPSFPSGHTAISFAVVTVLYLRKEKYWYISFVLAVLIAFSRMYLYVHFPTDVLGGCVLGILCGGLAVMLFKKLDRSNAVNRKEEK